MSMSVIMCNLLPFHLQTQDEDKAFNDETEVLQFYYDNFNAVDIARGTINQIQEEVGLNLKNDNWWANKF